MSVIASLREGNRLDAGSVRGYGILLAVINVIAFAWVVITARDGIDRYGQIIGSDFLSFWTVGRLLTQGIAPYDGVAHLAAMRDLAPDLAPGYPAFYYPPLFLPLCLPLGLLPYAPALIAWLAATGAAYCLAVRLWITNLGWSLPFLIWLLALPPVLITVLHGQTSFLAAALLAGGLILVGDRPWLAGFLIGLAAFKPQYGPLVPIALLVTGNWRAIAGAVIGASSLAAVAIGAFGLQPWEDWLALGAEAQAAMASGAIGYGKMVSIFAGTRLLGLPEGLAYAAQWIASGAVAAMVAWAGWRRGWNVSLAALVLAGAPLATPFVLDYDMVLLAFPLLYLAGTGYRPWEKSISAVVFIAPALARPLAMQFGIPLMPLAMAALFWAIWHRSMADTQGRPHHAPR